MKWFLPLAVALMAGLFCAGDAFAGHGFVQQRFVVQSAPHCNNFQQQAFVQQRVFVPRLQRQQVLVVPQSFGFQRQQQVFVQQQPLFNFRVNIDD